MARRALTLLAAGALAASVLAGCGGDDVVASTLPVQDVPAPRGPAYVFVDNAFQGTIHTPDGDTDIGQVDGARWTSDGHVIALTQDGLVSWDASTGRRVGTTDRAPGGVGVTPGTVTTVSGRRVSVLGTDLAEQRTVEVPESAFGTDQADEVSVIELYGDPLTLDGVTWATWAVDSENEDKDDHGIVRIDGDEVSVVQRNEPVVRLYAASDGAALLMLRQRSGDEDCGGCSVEQEVVELDPATGEVAGEYGTPPGYDRSWRVNAVDKVGDRLVVRYEVGSSEDEDEATYEWQTWVYDGAWSRLEEAGSTRTWWQDGGRLVETPEWDDNNLTGGTPYTLDWVHDGTTTPEFRPSPERCDVQEGETFCPERTVPGALLPPAG